MRAAIQKAVGGVETLLVSSVPKPVPKAGEVLIAVKATAINRADTLQRAGRYPAPKGESEILGLEAAGTIAEVGPGTTTGFKAGDSVMALLQGGGYAEYAAVPHSLCMRIPKGFTYEHAACIPEVWLTAFQHLHLTAKIQKGETILVHAGASGVGTAAIQLAKAAGASRIIATAGSADKLELCRRLGATDLLNYKELQGAFSESVLKATDNRGADIILDCVGASYFTENAKSCALDARWVFYGSMGGTKIESDLKFLLAKRVNLHSSTLRSRSLAYRSELVARFAQEALPGFTDGRFQVVHDRTLDLSTEGVQEAHRVMEANQNAGKVVLRVAQDAEAVAA